MFANIPSARFFVREEPYHLIRTKQFSKSRSNEASRAPSLRSGCLKKSNLIHQYLTSSSLQNGQLRRPRSITRWQLGQMI